MDRKKIDPIENEKKVCKCNKCGYPVRPIRMFPNTECRNCDKGTMIELKNCICDRCLEEKNTIPGNNCLNCHDGIMIESKSDN